MISSTKTITTNSATVPSQVSQPGEHQLTKRRQPHVPVAAQRDDRAEHRQPQEQEGGEFVGPDDRAVEHVARDDAGKQNAGLRQHQQRAERLADAADHHVEGEGGAAHAAP